MWWLTLFEYNSYPFPKFNACGLPILLLLHHKFSLSISKTLHCRFSIDWTCRRDFRLPFDESFPSVKTGHDYSEYNVLNLKHSKLQTHQRNEPMPTPQLSFQTTSNRPLRIGKTRRKRRKQVKKGPFERATERMKNTSILWLTWMKNPISNFRFSLSVWFHCEISSAWE